VHCSAIERSSPIDRAELISLLLLFITVAAGSFPGCPRNECTDAGEHVTRVLNYSISVQGLVTSARPPPETKLIICCSTGRFVRIFLALARPSSRPRIASRAYPDNCPAATCIRLQHFFSPLSHSLFPLLASALSSALSGDLILPVASFLASLRAQRRREGC